LPDSGNFLKVKTKHAYVHAFTDDMLEEHRINQTYGLFGTTWVLALTTASSEEAYQTL